MLRPRQAVEGGSLVHQRLFGSASCLSRDRFLCGTCHRIWFSSLPAVNLSAPPLSLYLSPNAHAAGAKKKEPGLFGYHPPPRLQRYPTLSGVDLYKCVFAS